MTSIPSPSRQTGSASVLVAISLVVLGGFSAMAVDYGYLQVKRNQLQTAADASALAGASAILSYRGIPATIANLAVTYAQRNIPAADQPTLAARVSDVRLLKDGVANTAAPNQIEVTVGMTQARGNPVRLFFASILGKGQADLTATARAGLYAVAGSKCIKPFTVPTKFTWNDQCDSNNQYKNNGKFDVASSCEKASVQVIGYSSADMGAPVTLKQGDPHTTIAPGQYNPVDFPPVNRGNPVSGGSTYRDNIAGCTGSNTNLVANGDEIALEPGNMTGPTKQGIQELLSDDPSAYWDSSCNCIKGSTFTDPMTSPRVGLISFYDPRYPPESGRNSIYVYQLGAVFIEGLNNNGDVTGRFIEAMASSAGAAGSNSLLYSIRLVRDSSRGGN